MTLGLACLAAVSAGQDLTKTERSWYLGGGIAYSPHILGSGDVRHGYYFSVAYGQPEKRLQFRKLPCQLIWQAYVLPSFGDTINNVPGFRSISYGALAIARYRWPRKNGWGFYFDLGFGLDYVNRVSRDVDSHFNTTPYGGFGLATLYDRGELFIGAHFLHISNAGTNYSNRGQNQITIGIEYRYRG